MSDTRRLIPGEQGVTIRRLRLQDVTSIDAMHDRVSKESLYYRYFTSCKPSLEALRQQAHASCIRGAAFVAVLQSLPEEIVGLAYYVLTPDDSSTAEPALLVEDRYQGQGLGRALMDRLVHEAKANALGYFRVIVLPTNQRAMKILNRSGLPLERCYRDGVLEVRLNLASDRCARNSELGPLPVAI